MASWATVSPLVCGSAVRAFTKSDTCLLGQELSQTGRWIQCDSHSQGDVYTATTVGGLLLIAKCLLNVHRK